MSAPLIHDSAHWKRRAEEARRVAEQLDDDPAAKATMIEIAESYERLAEIAAKRQTTDKTGC